MPFVETTAAWARHGHEGGALLTPEQFESDSDEGVGAPDEGVEGGCIDPQRAPGRGRAAGGVPVRGAAGGRRSGSVGLMKGASQARGLPSTAGTGGAMGGSRTCASALVVL